MSVHHDDVASYPESDASTVHKPSQASGPVEEIAYQNEPVAESQPAAVERVLSKHPPIQTVVSRPEIHFGPHVPGESISQLNPMKSMVF